MYRVYPPAFSAVIRGFARAVCTSVLAGDGFRSNRGNLVSTRLINKQHDNAIKRNIKRVIIKIITTGEKNGFARVVYWYIYYRSSSGLFVSNPDACSSTTATLDRFFSAIGRNHRKSPILAIIVVYYNLVPRTLGSHFSIFVFRFSIIDFSSWLLILRCGYFISRGVGSIFAFP